MAGNEDKACCDVTDIGNNICVMENKKRLTLSRESHILLAICMLDLLSTFWLVTTGRAVEGNPVMLFYLRKGWLALILAKIMLSVLPIFILEWCRRYHPRFVHRMLRVAIIAYLGMYLLVFVHGTVFSLTSEYADDNYMGIGWSEKVKPFNQSNPYRGCEEDCREVFMAQQKKHLF